MYFYRRLHTFSVMKAVPGYLTVLAVAFSPTFFAGSAKAATIAAGNQHSVSIRNDGIVIAWGYNYYGQLGNGTQNESNVPVIAKNLVGANAVVAGDSFSLLIKSNALYGWGNNGYGQIGDGTTTSTSAPTVSPYLNTGVTAIAAGDQHGLAVQNGQVWAWGYNYYGQLGDGGSKNSAPKSVAGMSSAKMVAAGTSFSLALKSDGTVWSWGGNNYGQLGNGNNTSQSTPVAVSGLSNIVAIAAGRYHALALGGDGRVWAWGYNYYCQLGASQDKYGYCANSNVPVNVASLSGVVAIAAGANHSVVLKSDGTVWGWGENSYKQLGNSGSCTSSYSCQTVTPIQAQGVSGITSIAAGGSHTLALTSSQDVWAWGLNATLFTL